MSTNKYIYGRIQAPIGTREEWNTWFAAGNKLFPGERIIVQELNNTECVTEFINLSKNNADSFNSLVPVGLPAKKDNPDAGDNILVQPDSVAFAQDGTALGKFNYAGSKTTPIKDITVHEQTVELIFTTKEITQQIVNSIKSDTAPENYESSGAARYRLHMHVLDKSRIATGGTRNYVYARFGYLQGEYGSDFIGYKNSDDWYDLDSCSIILQRPSNFTIVAEKLAGNSTDLSDKDYKLFVERYPEIGTETFGIAGFAAGYSNYAIGSASGALGERAQTLHTASIALGHTVIASGYCAVAAGVYTRAEGSRSIAIGKSAFTGLNAQDAVALGINAQAQGVSAIAIRGTANAASSIAIGGVANAENAFAFGGTASGANAVSIKGTASGENSFAFRGESSGLKSIAIGINAKATGARSIAIGTNSANNKSAPVASGDGAVAIGPYSTAIGNESVAIGYQTTAKGEKSTAIGQGTIAQGWQVVVGKYNKETAGMNAYDDRDPTHAAFIVGVGRGATTGGRANGFVVWGDGHASIGKGPSTDLDVATKQYVDSHIGNAVTAASNVFITLNTAPNENGQLDANATDIEGNLIIPKKGDILIVSGNSDEYIYTGTKWNPFGAASSQIQQIATNTQSIVEIQERVSDIEADYATQEDLESYATKASLDIYATKESLDNYATTSTTDDLEQKVKTLHNNDTAHTQRIEELEDNIESLTTQVDSNATAISAQATILSGQATALSEHSNAITVNKQDITQNSNAILELQTKTVAIQYKTGNTQTSLNEKGVQVTTEYNYVHLRGEDEYAGGTAGFGLGRILSIGPYQTIVGRCSYPILGPHDITGPRTTDPTRAIFVVGAGHSHANGYKRNGLIVWADGHVSLGHYGEVRGQFVDKTVNITTEGQIVVQEDPTQDLEVATKQYVDKLNNATKQNVESLESKLDNNIASVNALDTALETTQQNIENSFINFNTNLATLETEVGKLNGNITSAIDRIETLENTTQEISTTLEDEVKKLDENIAGTIGRVDALDTALETTRQSVNTLSTSIDNIQQNSVSSEQFTNYATATDNRIVELDGSGIGTIPKGRVTTIEEHLWPRDTHNNKIDRIAALEAKLENITGIEILTEDEYNNLDDCSFAPSARCLYIITE